ncbi:MAG: hypothetical protein E8D45_11805 [Nitrospira sp.]|nr:MAG: hypothetical protein E8D45_11805 [Nitrospira sp.]
MIGKLTKLREVFKRHPGSTSVSFMFTVSPDLEVRSGSLPNVTVTPSGMFVSEVEGVLGRGAVALLHDKPPAGASPAR